MDWFCAKAFRSNEEVTDGVKVWLNGRSAAVCVEGTKKLVTGYDKCRNIDGDYIEK